MNELDAPEQESRVIEAFTAAAIMALQELTQLAAIVDELPAVDSVATGNWVVATVRLNRQLPGTMTLLLSNESASTLAARYLPRGTELTAEMINDVAGEFANVIAGQAKTILKGTPYHFALSAPAVTRAPVLSQLAQVVEHSRVGSITFDTGRLLLVIDLSPCADC